MGVARFQVGASARWNDLQHIYPKELGSSGKTMELKAWQTKTLSQVEGKKHPTPLICPKRSFTGRLWYHGFLNLVEKDDGPRSPRRSPGSPLATPRQRGARWGAGTWQWPGPGTEWTLLKADVTKAQAHKSPPGGLEVPSRPDR